MACQIAARAANAGRRVAFVSLEMDRAQIVGRMIRQRLGFDERDADRLTEDENAQMDRALTFMDHWPLRCDTRRPATMENILNRRESGSRSFVPELLVIDYLQLIAARDPRARRFDQISEIVREVVDTAKRLQVPILALAQLNREAESAKAKDARPRLSHLRESGSIETETDVVWLIYRPELGSDTEVIIAKNRFGDCGTVNLVWNARFTIFDQPNLHADADAFD